MTILKKLSINRFGKFPFKLMNKKKINKTKLIYDES